MKSSIRQQVKDAVPAGVKTRLRGIEDSARDMMAPGIPPRRIRRTISPLWFDFKKTGNDQLEFLVELAGLTPDARVLDVGCGVGRLAVPLAAYLTRGGHYEGFDIANDCVEWCRDNIESKHSNFHFAVADVSTSDLPGAVPPDDYVFPYADDSFDVVYVGSVFTHLLPGGSENYLSEISRVLAPGGRLVGTWLLYNKETEALISGAGISRYCGNDHGIYRTARDDIPEAKVAHEESSARQMHSSASLSIAEPIRVDASYNPARIPADRSQGLHLYYSQCIIAVKTV